MRTLAAGAIALVLAVGAAGCLSRDGGVTFTSDVTSGASFTADNLPSHATFKIDGAVTVPSCDETDAARDGGICTPICPHGGRVSLWTYGVLVGDTFRHDQPYPVSVSFRPETVDRKITCND